MAYISSETDVAARHHPGRRSFIALHIPPSFLPSFPPMPSSSSSSSSPPSSSSASWSRDRGWPWGSLRPWQLLHSKLDELEISHGSASDMYDLLNEALGGVAYGGPQCPDAPLDHLRLLLDDDEEEDVWGLGGVMESRIQEWVSREGSHDPFQDCGFDVDHVLRCCREERYMNLFHLREEDEEEKEKEKEEEICPVCLERFGWGERVLRLPCCIHKFHKACLTPWIQMGHRYCPCCRADILANNTSTNPNTNPNLNPNPNPNPNPLSPVFTSSFLSTPAPSSAAEIYEQPLPPSSSSSSYISYSSSSSSSSSPSEVEMLYDPFSFSIYPHTSSSGSYCRFSEEADCDTTVTYSENSEYCNNSSSSSSGGFRDAQDIMSVLATMEAALDTLGLRS